MTGSEVNLDSKGFISEGNVKSFMKEIFSNIKYVVSHAS
jgi:hypothetical protein